MNNGFVFDLDPALVHIGPLEIRYYSIIFVLMLYAGFYLWRRQMIRGGYSVDVAESFLIWGVIAVTAGSRLGHCLFYDPAYYFSHPLHVFYLWEGGLSSHGATIGLILTLWLFARHYKLNFIEVLDRFSFSAAVGAAAVRLGNFFNSEIVGRATDVPWAVRFMRYDHGMVARHPSQLYEFVLGLFVLLVLVLADRWTGRENRPTGLLAGLFMTVYFAGRFMVEYVKEYQALADSGLTMGQYLSIVPFFAGVALLIWVWRTRT